MSYRNLSRYMKSSTRSVLPSFLLALLLSTSHDSAADQPYRFELLKKAALRSGITDPRPSCQSLDDELAELGEGIFESKSLSLNGDISCRDCHQQEAMSSDGIPLAVGVGASGVLAERVKPGVKTIIPRNTFPLFGRGDAAFTRFFWDGRVERNGSITRSPFGQLGEDLEPSVVALHLPAVEIREMLVETEEVSSQFKRESPEVAQKLFGVIVESFARREASIIRRLASHLEVAEESIEFQHLAVAMREFIRRDFPVPFTEFHDFVFEGRRISDSAFEGAELFYGKARCSACHNGPFFSDLNFYAVPSPQLGAGKNGFGVDYGRFNATHRPSDLYKFRTPPLLAVGETAPYMHSGSVGNLEAVIGWHVDPLAQLDFADLTYEERHNFLRRVVQSDQIAMASAPLSEHEIQMLASFLRTLSPAKGVPFECEVPGDL